MNRKASSNPLYYRTKKNSGVLLEDTIYGKALIRFSLTRQDIQWIKKNPPPPHLFALWHKNRPLMNLFTISRLCAYKQIQRTFGQLIRNTDPLSIDRSGKGVNTNAWLQSIFIWQRRCAGPCLRVALQALFMAAELFKFTINCFDDLFMTIYCDQ